MTHTEIIRAALERYAAETIGADRARAEQLALQAYDMAAAIGCSDDHDCASLVAYFRRVAPDH